MKRMFNTWEAKQYYRYLDCLDRVEIHKKEKRYTPNCNCRDCSTVKYLETNYGFSADNTDYSGEANQ